MGMEWWTMRNKIFIAAAVVILLIINGLIAGKERLLSEGKTIFLDLAPVDPRSLMQGDYMALRYRIADEVEKMMPQVPNDGCIVVEIAGSGAAKYRRIHDSAVPIGKDEHLLRYRTRNGRVRIGAESFFFQEGRAKLYEKAHFGELCVAESGDSVLVGLRGDYFEKLGNKMK
jgi:uncharacterized membrane-anchored protein